MLLHLTKITERVSLNINKDLEEGTREVIKKEMLIEQDTIIRAYEQGGMTKIVIRCPYGGSALGYEEISYSVEEPLKYILSGKETDRVTGKCLDE